MTTNNPTPQPAGESGMGRMEDNSMNGNDPVYIEPKLEPCPFCGVVPPSDSYYMNQGDKWGGIQCCVQGPEVRTYYEAWPNWKQAAIDAWNTRATPTDVAERARRVVEAFDDAGYLDETFISEMADCAGSDRRKFFEACKVKMADIIAAEFGGEDSDPGTQTATRA